MDSFLPLLFSVPISYKQYKKLKFCVSWLILVHSRNCKAILDVTKDCLCFMYARNFDQVNSYNFMELKMIILCLSCLCMHVHVCMFMYVYAPCVFLYLSEARRGQDTLSWDYRFSAHMKVLRIQNESFVRADNVLSRWVMSKSQWTNEFDWCDLKDSWWAASCRQLTWGRNCVFQTTH